MSEGTGNNTYTQEQMEQLAQAAAKAATDSLLQQLNLDNRIENASSDTLEGKGISRVPPKRLQAKVIVNDQVRWVHGYNQQELFDDYVGLLEREGIILWAGQSKPIPILEVYLKKFIETFKSGQASLTVINRDRLMKKHIIPKMGKKRLDQITTTDVQEWYNDLGKIYSKETILKLRNIVSPAMDAAAEEGLIPRNPFKSVKLEIGGKETVHHKAIPRAKFDLLKQSLPNMEEKE